MNHLSGDDLLKCTNSCAPWPRRPGLIDGNPEWKDWEGQSIYFLENSHTWLWGSQSSGFWRSSDSGVTWQAIPGMNPSHLQGAQLHRRKDGTFFLATVSGIWRSRDGEASHWRLVPTTQPIVGGLVSNRKWNDATGPASRF